MSYIDIPLTNEYVFFDIIDHQTDDPVVNPQFPIGIGMNFGTLYDLGCRIRIHELLSEYHLSFSDVLSATLYLYGTNSVGDMDVYSTSGAISDSPITPTNFNYEIPLEDTYDSTYCGYLFKMSTLSAISYSTFINTGSYVRIEFYDNTSIYVSSLPTKRNYFYGEQLDLTGLKIKFIKNDSTEVEIFNYTSTPLNNAYLYPTNNTVTFYYVLGNAIKTCSIQINVDNIKEDILYDTSALDGSGNEMHDFDIHMPSTPPPQNGFPVVVTIHGGNFCGGQKEDYNYITPFLINNGCIHVNMNYRLMPIPEENNNSLIVDREHYTDMISDIDALINYLYNHSTQYHINVNKIGLMGYSAGGNIAFNYTLRSYLNSGDDAIQSAIPIKLIITQGAPFFSELTKENNDLEIEYNDPNPYINNPTNITNIKNEIKVLTGFGTAYELELSKIKPLSFLQNGQNFPINLFIQGTGFNDYGYQAQEYQLQMLEYQGDGFISEKGINTLIEQRGQANDIHKTLIKFCSHSNYNTMTFTDSDCLSDLEDTIEDFVDLVC